MSNKKDGIGSLESFADSQAEAQFAENQEIARTLRVIRTQCRDQQQELDDIRNRLGLYERIEGSRITPPKWLTPKRKKSDIHLAIPSMLLTDIHWGERIAAEQVGGINKYDVEIAHARVRRAFDRAVFVARQSWAGIEYEGFNLLLGGDILSGVIHEELRETNEETVFASILGAVEALTAGVRLLANEFPSVHVASVVGNHGRLTRKPRAKNKATESLDWMAYQLLARELESTPNVTTQVAEAADLKFSVYNSRICLTHGDQFRGGSGIAGALSPLLLGVHRKLKRDAAAGQPFDVLVMGHWHHSYWMQDLIVGGSIKGYDEYAYDRNLGYQEPLATLWLNTPEHGITTYSPLFVQDREREGW